VKPSGRGTGEGRGHHGPPELVSLILRAISEQALAARERTPFNLDDTIYLYDLTSTYFEGQCATLAALQT
jgi:hypothetical protein